MSSAIYDYLDYRQFINDRVALKKEESRGISLRQMAKKAGVDPGTLTRILQGKRNISLVLALKLARMLSLKKRETEYFQLLVLFNQAGSEQEKADYLEELHRLRNHKTATVDKHQYEYFENWYNVAIRELLNFYPFFGDFKELAKKFDPPVKPSEAKKAVELLQRLGMVEKGKDGKYRLSSKFISTGEEWHSVAIHNLHGSIIDLARKALERLPKEKRDFSALTLSLSPEGFEEIQKKIKAFRTELMDIARKDRNIGGVYQINFQAFPLVQDARSAEDE